MSRDTPFDDQIDYRHLSQAPYKRPRVEDDDINDCNDGIGTSGLRLPSRYVSCDEKRVLQPRSSRTFATTSSDSLSSKQRRLISQWNLDFREPTEDDDVWPDEHLTALATAIRATPQIVVDFIRQQQLLSNTEVKGILPHKPSSVPSSERSGSYPPFGSYDLPGANAHLPSTILTLVDKYVSACRRRRSQTDGRRSVNKGPYRCTFGCGYCTKRAFDWRRHEETHEPQELWLCELCCQKDALNPFLVNRRDKFLRHAMDKHAGYSAEKVLEMSKVQFVPRAAEGCPFCTDEVAKGWSWEERCRHVLGHFEDEVEKSKKKPIIIKEREDSCDEEDRRSMSGSDESAESNEEEQ